MPGDDFNPRIPKLKRCSFCGQTSEQVRRSLRYAYEGRKMRKRDFRRLWITRINAAARMNGISYSVLMNGLKQRNIAINRKMLADIAVNDPAAFTKLVETVKG